MTDYIQLDNGKNLNIGRHHFIDGYTLQYLPTIHGIDGEANHIENPNQLQHVMQQIYDFLIYDKEKHKTDLETYSHWVNHGEEKEYITGLAVIHRLVLAKFVKDSLYDQLVAEALPYIQRSRFFKNMTEQEFQAKLEKNIKEKL